MSLRRHLRRMNARTFDRARSCSPETVLATGRMTPARERFQPDAQDREAFLYTVALHAPPRSGVSLHGLSFTGPTYRLMFTARTSAARERFIQGVNRDLAGYLRARFGWETCRFVLDDLVHLEGASESIQAAALLVREGHAFAG